MSSSLVLEINFVNFPESKPGKVEGETPEPWDLDTRRKFYHQESEIHFIQIGLVDQEVLDSKLTHMELGGVEFCWNELKQLYCWNSGPNLSGALPHKFYLLLLQELKKVGFGPVDQYYYPDSHHFENGEKKIWTLERKF